jgi:U3 small nucleolar ribonucleoprotein component
MATVNVYERYFEAEGTFNEVERRAANVMLVSDSEAGQIRYEACVSFFPHRDEEDFAISYDAFFSKVMFEGKGRRSKKREEKLLEELKAAVDEMALENGAAVFWDRPLIDERRG